MGGSAGDAMKTVKGNLDAVAGGVGEVGKGVTSVASQAGEGLGNLQKNIGSFNLGEQTEEFKKRAQMTWDAARHDADYAKHWHKDEAEHGPSRKSRSERLRSRAMKRSERSGAEWGDYDYEDKRVQKMLSKASELDERSGNKYDKKSADIGRFLGRMTMTKNIKPLPKKKG